MIESVGDSYINSFSKSPRRQTAQHSKKSTKHKERRISNESADIDFEDDGTIGAENAKFKSE